jgi:flavin-dependent dehydrogenase
MFRLMAIIPATLMAADALASAPLGVPAGQVVGSALGTVVPFSGGGLAALATAGVVAGIWIVKRKR